MLNHLELFINDLRVIFRKDRSIKKPFLLFFTHIRLKTKQKFFEAFHIKKTKETFLGMTVMFSDYGWFCHLWRELFVSENYSFTAGNDHPYIVDVGSNVGMSVCFFKYIYPNAEIIAFEPDPTAFEYLKNNIAANHFENVTINNVAVGAEDGTIDFWQDAGIKASGINSVLTGFIDGTSAKITVPEKRLSPFITGKRVDFLKVDVEGAEFEIFKEIDGKMGTVEHISLELHQRTSFLNDPIHTVLGILDHNGFRYAMTAVFFSHHDFEGAPDKHYAFMVDAQRPSNKT